VQKHEKYDEAVAEKLNDELITVYERDVAEHPSRYGPFMNILRRLRPLIAHPERTARWWDLLQPTLQVLNQEKHVAEESQALVLEALTADWGDDTDHPGPDAAIPLAEKLVALWLEECVSVVEPEDTLANFKEKQIRETLIMYGKKRPHDFMVTLDKFMVKKEWRARTLHLVAEFIRNRPPHLYQILQTQLFNSILNCLQLDTSTTVVSLALTVLIMVLPHMPSSLVPHLPALFNIYARLLFWERELSPTDQEDHLVAEQRLSPGTTNWHQTTFTPEFDDKSIPHLLNYFTILYGLYPINFMDYIRKPQRYLRHAEVPNPDDIEVQPTEIRHASEPFRQCHVLHENFYTLTIDSEKTDFGRWYKSEPAEVITDCMALRQPLGSMVDSMISRFGYQEPPVLNSKGDTDKAGPESALLSTSAPPDDPPDVAVDAPVDAHAHITVDAPTDGSTDAPTDPPTDASPDAPIDDPADDPTDEPTDEPTDDSTDAPTDTPPDVSVDAPPDTSTPNGVEDDSLVNVETAPDELSVIDVVAPTLVRQSSQSSHQSPPDAASIRPSASSVLPSTGSFTHLQDMIDSNKTIKSSLSQSLANDSSPSVALSRQDSVPDGPLIPPVPNFPGVDDPIASTSDKDAQIKSLYRQILLLRNDLIFERFMKQQHLTHMGYLRRKQVREAASEAEAQNLIMATRNLKLRLEEAKKTEIQIKKDSEKSRALSKKWEAELSAKLRTIRQEQKKWLEEGEALREELQKEKAEADALRKLVCDGEVRELGWKQQMQYVEANTSEMERLRTEVRRLEDAERNWQAQEAERQAAISHAAEADGRAEILQMKLDAREVEFQQTRDLYQSQIVVLNAKLQEALKSGAERHADNLKAQLENALAANRAQQSELQTRIAELTKRNTALNGIILELQTRTPTRLLAEPELPRPGSSDVDMSITSEEGSPLSFRNRQHRGLSDPELFEATSFNPTPPLQPFDSFLAAPSRRPLTPTGTDASGSVSGSTTSPIIERYHGRGEVIRFVSVLLTANESLGGVQNIVRKEKKEKKEDKEKKKSSGIRGIRGFV
jgi:hypothetical protein